MNGRRAIVGLCMLCALLTSAFAAQNASAITGTTAFTCVQGGGDKALRGEHCLSTGTAFQNYGHVPIAQDTTTELTTTNSKAEGETTTPSIVRLKMTIGGVPLELSATGAGAIGWMENKVSAGEHSLGEHYAHGKGTTTFTGVEVTQPAGRGCKVTTHKEDGSGSPGEEGEVEVIHSRELTATTEDTETPLEDFVKLQPANGPTGSFANFFITCTKEPKIPTIEGTWSCVGSVKGLMSGATVVYTHAESTLQNTLKCRGSKVGLEVKTTGSGRAKGSEGAYTPLATTKVTT